MLKRFAFFLCLLPGVASAQPHDTCMLAGELDAALIDWHGERVFEESSDGRAAIWRNAETGSWTFVQYLDSGLGCVLDYGQTWPPNQRSPEVMAQLSR